MRDDALVIATGVCLTLVGLLAIVHLTAWFFVP